jgi:hypothetical protein
MLDALAAAAAAAADACSKGRNLNQVNPGFELPLPSTVSEFFDSLMIGMDLSEKSLHNLQIRLQ